ncbi:hypothetical protein ABB02_00827 [Clostridiaceae bacterium JG1575]|nr:hypothetical protein ABB02_00827 [Clostridiaceae bacterium JG1575]
MCSRFEMSWTKRDLENLREILAQFSAPSMPWPKEDPVGPQDYAPSEVLPIFTPQGFVPMRWGFPMGTKRIINGRAESLLKKPFFRSLWGEGRCLIPATRFYEWHRERPYAIHLKDSLLFMAGLFRPMPPCDRGPTGEFIILTQEASPPMNRIHSRMPVLVPRHALKDYLREEAIAESFNPFLGEGSALIIEPLHGEQLSFFDV